MPINIEIDTNPPQGWKNEKSIVNIYLPILIQHYNKASLLATKVIALFTRPYTKGRDVYDIFWFRSKWKDLKPNFELLNNGLLQITTLRKKVTFNEENWLGILKEKIETLNWKEVINDARPFIENPDELLTFSKENMLLLFSE